MKKLIVLFILIFQLFGCVKTAPPIIDQTEGIHMIDAKTLEDKIENNHRFILYIGRSDCKDCIEFHPLLEDFINSKSSLGVYYIDLKSIRDEAFKENTTKEAQDFFNHIKDYLDFHWTPTLQYREGKKIIRQITYLDENSTGTKEEKEQSLDAIKQWLIDIDFK